VSTYEKTIEKMQRQPNGVSASEMTRVLNKNGYRFDRQRGSHIFFINEHGDVFSFVDESPVKAIYVKKLLERIL